MSDEQPKTDEQSADAAEPEVERAEEAATAGHERTAAEAHTEATEPEPAAEATEAHAEATEPEPAAEAAEPHTEATEPEPAAKADEPAADGAVPTAEPAAPFAAEQDLPRDAAGRPELIVGAAFVGGLLLAWMLKRRVG